MPWVPHLSRSERAGPGLAPGRGGPDPATQSLVQESLDPVLVPLGFAPGQVGGEGKRGQAIFCRGEAGSPDGGCVDLVLDLVASPEWRVSDVRYWGFPSDRWHLDFDRDALLGDQLRGLATTLPDQLEHEAR